MDQKSLTPFGGSRAPASSRSFDPIDAMRREMDRLFESFSQGGLFGGLPAALSGGNGFLSPKVDVCETDKGLEVTAELPGIDEKNIDVNLEDGVLTLKAEHAAEKEEKDEKKHYHLVERSHGTFMRRIALPFEPDADNVEATFEKGVLKITVPKSANAAEKVRKIAITGA